MASYLGMTSVYDLIPGLDDAVHDLIPGHDVGEKVDDLFACSQDSQPAVSPPSQCGQYPNKTIFHRR